MIWVETCGQGWPPRDRGESDYAGARIACIIMPLYEKQGIS
jgi:hypothetical protein